MLGAVKAVGWQLWAERLGAGGSGTGVARPHIPACPQSGIVLATPPLFHRDFWKGLMDARCREHRHPGKTLKREEGELGQT